VANLYSVDDATDEKGIGRAARRRLGKLVNRRAQLGELNIQTQPIYGPRASTMKLREARERSKKGA
jgi:hypothetical protein